jgi:hypothetical protein
VLSFSSLTGSYSIEADGRGTVALTTAAGTANFVAYVVSANKINLMGSDAVLAGCVEKQGGQTFSAADVSGGYAYLVNRAPASNLNTFDIIGRASFDGRGSISGGTQEEAALLTQNNITGGTYSVASNGRGSMQITTDNGNRSYRFYMLSPTRIYMLDTFTTWAGTGPADSQVATPDNSTLKGTYALNGASIGQDDTGLSMWLTADGAGHFSGVADLIQHGEPASVVVNATYQVTDNGRTFVMPSHPVGVVNFVFYVVSEQQAQVLGSQPTLDGALRLQ